MPVEKMAPADLAVPYAAPKVVRTMAVAQPRAPKKGCVERVKSEGGLGKGVGRLY
jgi:hypothetical protein